MNPRDEPLIKEIALQRLRTRTATVAIIGLGYVGLPLALRCSEVGFQVVGLDIDQQKVDALNRATSYIAHISSETIRDAISRGLVATTDFSAVNRADAIVVCVPTPLNKYREPDLSFVINTVDAIVPYLRP